MRMRNARSAPAPRRWAVSPGASAAGPQSHCLRPLSRRRMSGRRSAQVRIFVLPDIGPVSGRLSTASALSDRQRVFSFAILFFLSFANAISARAMTREPSNFPARRSCALTGLGNPSALSVSATRCLANPFVAIDATPEALACTFPNGPRDPA